MPVDVQQNARAAPARTKPAPDALRDPLANDLADPLDGSRADPSLQLEAAGPTDGATVDQAAAGASGPGSELPHLDRIQPSFGRHDVGGVEAHTDANASEAARSMGARGFTIGSHVGFRGEPTLHTAAHEAAHVVQQRAGVHLDGDVGQQGDRYERHADAVADRVEAGESAEGLLDQVAGSGGGPAVQLDYENTVEDQNQAAETAMKVQDGELMTWDPNLKGPDKGGWVSAAGQRGSEEEFIHPNLAGDEKDERFTTGLDPTQQSEDRYAILDEIGRQLDLKNGHLTWSELVALPMETAIRIDPMSDVPRNLLKEACKSSWNIAKSTLAAGTTPAGDDLLPEQQAVLKQIMRKIWEFRQWDHLQVLEATKKKVNESHGAGSLTAFPSAGSAALTSDIDVNLKGSNTEAAVKAFNQVFKNEYKGGWPYEAGVVYDVNVYALDFMHKPGGVKAKDFDESGVKEVGQEGIRSTRATGGISDEEQQEVDADRQEVWSLVHVRRYMNDSEWKAYRADCDPTDQRAETWAAVEQKFKAYQDEVVEAMLDKTQPLIQFDVFSPVEMETGDHQLRSFSKQLAGSLATGGQDKQAVADDILIGASNRVYEQKLAALHEQREKLAKDVAMYEGLVKMGVMPGAQVVEQRINAQVLALRELLSEIVQFSNEAYVTGGAINHAVVGMQVGAGISQTKAASMNAVNENLGDCLKEISHHGDHLWKAAYKAGKYMYRLADAALNMGSTVGNLGAMRAAGHEISEVIKKQDLPDKEGKTLTVVKDQLSITDPGPSGVSELKSHIVGTTVDVSKDYDESIRADRLELGGKVENRPK